MPCITIDSIKQNIYQADARYSIENKYIHVPTAVLRSLFHKGKCLFGHRDSGLLTSGICIVIMVSYLHVELNSSDRKIVCGSRDSTPEELQLNGTCCVSILATIHTMSTIGRRVKICGLKSLKDLNGGEGVVQEELLNGRLRVLMTNFSNLVISVGHENPLFI